MSVIAGRMGDPNGCGVCHGGNPSEETNAVIAHQGVPKGSPLEAFNRHSASMWINDKTCGICHQKWVYAGHRSVMPYEQQSSGYGTHDGRYMTAYTRGVYVDISTANGEILSKSAQPQISPIPELPMDLNQVVTRNNKQVQTVGHHWPLSGPLTKEMRDRMEQVGVCIACHKDIPVVGFNLVHDKSFHSQVMGRLLRAGQSFHNFSNQSDTLPR